MDATTTNRPHTPEEARAWLRQVRDRKAAWQEKVSRDYAELQVEVERAKENPFYQRGTNGMACEPAPVPQPVFKQGSFVAAIRKHRAYQQQWQERINRELDDMEEQRHKYQEQFQLEADEA